MVDLSGDNLAFHRLELRVDGVFLQVENLRGKRLAKRKNGSAPELRKHNLFRNLFADFTLRVDFAGIGQSDLHARILNFAVGHNFEVLIDFTVALVRIHDDNEILIRTEHFCQHIAE